MTRIEIARLSQQAVRESQSITWLAEKIGQPVEWAQYYYRLAQVARGNRNVQIITPDEYSESF